MITSQSSVCGLRGLYINRKSPYPEQESEEVGDDIVARVNPKSGEVENVEILFFSTRLLRDNVFEVPIVFENVAENFCCTEATNQH